MFVRQQLINQSINPLIKFLKNDFLINATSLANDFGLCGAEWTEDPWLVKMNQGSPNLTVELSTKHPFGIWNLIYQNQWIFKWNMSQSFNK